MGGWSSRIARADVGEFGFDGHQNGTRMAYAVELKTSAGTSRTVLRSVEEAKWLTARPQRLLRA